MHDVYLSAGVRPADVLELCAETVGWCMMFDVAGKGLGQVKSI